MSDEKESNTRKHRVSDDGEDDVATTTTASDTRLKRAKTQGMGIMVGVTGSLYL